MKTKFSILMMKIKIQFLVFVFSLLSIGIQAQNESNKSFRNIQRNQFSLELGGNGFPLSVNYERISPLNHFCGYSIRTGFAINDTPWLFVELNYLLGKRRHYLDVGVSSSIASDLYGGAREYIPHFGYRYQGLKGITVRILPQYVLPEDITTFALSLGYSFPRKKKQTNI